MATQSQNDYSSSSSDDNNFNYSNHNFPDSMCRVCKNCLIKYKNLRNSFDTETQQSCKRISATKKKYGQVCSFFAKFYIQNPDFWSSGHITQEERKLLDLMIRSPVYNNYGIKSQKALYDLLKIMDNDTRSKFRQCFKNFFHDGGYEYSILRIYMGSKESRVWLMKNKGLIELKFYRIFCKSSV